MLALDCRQLSGRRITLTPQDREWLEGQFDSLKHELSEKIDNAETKLLTAFYKWAATGLSDLR
jgi:hypothetical protein